MFCLQQIQQPHPWNKSKYQLIVRQASSSNVLWRYGLKKQIQWWPATLLPIFVEQTQSKWIVFMKFEALIRIVLDTWSLWAKNNNMCSPKIHSSFFFIQKHFSCLSEIVTFQIFEFTTLDNRLKYFSLHMPELNNKLLENVQRFLSLESNTICLDYTFYFTCLNSVWSFSQIAAARETYWHLNSLQYAWIQYKPPARETCWRHNVRRTTGFAGACLPCVLLSYYYRCKAVITLTLHRLQVIEGWRES